MHDRNGPAVQNLATAVLLVKMLPKPVKFGWRDGYCNDYFRFSVDFASGEFSPFPLPFSSWSELVEKLREKLATGGVIRDEKGRLYGYEEFWKVNERYLLNQSTGRYEIVMEYKDGTPFGRGSVDSAFFKLSSILGEIKGVRGDRDRGGM